MAKDNQTILANFILLGLTNDPQLRTPLFLLFLLVYLITFVGNVVIMVVIKADSQLHTPMCFFLSHLSFVDICYSSVTVPKMLENFLAEQKTISFSGCIAQISFFNLFVAVEILTLSAMAYDRYTAICDPLHYMGIMNKQICVQVVLSIWALSFLDAVINTVPLLNLRFCGSNVISHFSCELPPLLQLSCTETTLNKAVLFSTLVMFGLSSFLLTLVSYIHIISTVLKIRTATGRQKAFSTCSSHLIVVSLLYLTGFFLYMKPNTVSVSMPDRLLSIQYSILTPMLNPIIYSLKNKEVKTALGKMLRKFNFFK